MVKASTVSEAAAVCEADAALPAGHEWYVDLSHELGANVVRELSHAIRNKQEAAAKGLVPREQGFAKALLTGLRGAGKSTQLNQLTNKLAEDGYYPVLISGRDELNLEHLTSVELLMSLLWALQDPPGMGRFTIKVPPRADEELNMVLASILVSTTRKRSLGAKLEAEFGVSAGIPLYAKVKAALQSTLAASVEGSREVKVQLMNRASAFITTLNHTLDEVQADLGRQGCKGLVFMVDELDRVPWRQAEGLPSMMLPQVLFDLQSADLQAPRAHMIYTFPSQLLVSVNLGRSWSERPLIMPAVKVADRSSRLPYEDGEAALRRLVEARVEVSRVFDPPEGLGELVRFSGGFIRDTLRLVRYAANRTDTAIGPEHVQRAKRDLIEELDRLVAPSLLESLSVVDHTQRLPPDPAYAELLYRNLVLTYANDEAWADLHPAVRETRGYRLYLQPKPS